MSRFFLAALIAVFLVSGAHAAPGDLDTTFGGGDGWVETPFFSLSAGNIANSIIRQTDGKLVAAGYITIHGNNYFALVRYNSDGSLDSGFGLGGKATTGTSTTSGIANAVIQQADGKLVATGVSFAGYGNDDFALVRYNSDGSLDTGFGTGGKAMTAFSSGTDEAYSVIQQADGKLVVAGSAQISSVYPDFALARYNADGSLDTTFSGDGKLTTAIGASYDYARSVIQQADGKLVVAGYSRNASNDDEFALVRYNSNGSLDTTFDTDGKLTTAIGAGADQAYSVIQQTDDKLVAAGISYNGSNSDFALVRYNADGSLDATFDGDGKLTTDNGNSNDFAFSVIQQADGKLVAAGRDDISSGYEYEDFALVRYNSDGSLDTTFDGDGIVTTAIETGSYDYAYSVIQQANGKLVAAGSSNGDFALVRYNTDGSLDAAFDTDGKVTKDELISDSYARSIVRQTDGKLVVAGYSSNASNHEEFALARYNVDGSLDTTFETDGKVTTAIGATADQAYSVIQQADGKLVVAGLGWDSSNEKFALVRYNADGSLDTTFDTDGKVATAIGGGIAQAYSVTQQTDGKLVAAGISYNGDNDDFALVRYNTDGSLDTTFSGDGKLTTAFESGDDQAYSVIQQADGKLVAAGYSYGGGNGNFALVRYNSDGSLDTTFSDDGKVVIRFGVNAAFAYSVIQQVDGKLVVAGYSRDGSNWDFALMRFESNGWLDPTFDGDGRLTTAIGAGNDQANSVIQQSDGKLVVAGYSSNGSNYDFALVRYNSDGSLDTTFDGDGKLTTAIGTGDDKVYSVTQQADGKLAVAGYSSERPDGNNFVVARYESGLLESDIDNDTFLNAVDNCPFISNANQLNTDGDAQGDVCDVDDDDDGVVDYSDACPVDATASSGNNDGDTMCDLNDLDDDTDGVPDTNDAFPFDSSEWADADSDGAGDNAEYDDDNDGVDDDLDNCPVAANADQINTDGDAQGDACDAAPDDKETAVKITAGDQHACTITNTGGVQCWGNNDYGQLGNNSYSYAYKPVAVRGLSSGITAITTGNYHTCALNSGGGVVCWGNNDYGQLGSYGYANVPKAVSGLSTGVVAISAGAYHTCALTNGGAVLCWGEYSFTPVAVSGLGGGVIAIAAGGYHDCALMSSGGAMCWGYNGYGQLGDNSTVDQPAPVAVSGLGSGVVAIEAGANHSCAVMGGGEMKCWGYNGDGELGDSSNVDQFVPVAVTGLSSIQAAVAGWGHSCSLSNDGAVHCWGANWTGQLGDGSGSDQYAPVAVSGLDKAVVAIAAGSYHSCAVTNEGGILCWGANWSGQLGDNSGSDQYVPVWVSGFEGVDSDGDGVVLDNCPSTANSDQLNTDGDTSGDACDGDDDNDGVLDVSDLFPLNPAEWLDTDSDGTGNNADMDDDNDGIPDYIDADPLNTAIHTEKILPLNGQYKGSALKETAIKQ